MTGEQVVQEDRATAKRPRRIRTRRWKIIVSIAVAGMLVLGAGVAIWRGPEVIPDGTMSASFCMTPHRGHAGVSGYSFQNESSSAVIIHSVRVVESSNAKVRLVGILDRVHGGIGIAELPINDPLFIAQFDRVRPARGYVIEPGHQVEVVWALSAVDPTRAGRLTASEIDYTVAGKPFAFRSTTYSEFVVRENRHGKSCNFHD